MVDLADKLDFISSGHRASVNALRLFVDEMRKGVEESNRGIGRLADNLRGVLREANSGTPMVLLESTAEPLSEGKPVAAGWLQKTISEMERLTLRFPALLLEMAFIYRVAIFDALVPDILSTVLVSRPEMLKSDKKLSHEQILEKSDMASLIALMAERELQSFAYQSIEDQKSWIKKHLGIELLADEPEYERTVELTARRNLFVHAAGLVNERYIQLVPKSSYKLGERVFVTDEYWAVSDGTLQMIADRLLCEVHEKFCRNT